MLRESEEFFGLALHNQFTKLLSHAVVRSLVASRFHLYKFLVQSFKGCFRLLVFRDVRDQALVLEPEVLFLIYVL